MKKAIVLLVLVLFSGSLYAYSATASWDAVTKNVDNEDCQIQNYTVYWGEQSRGSGQSESIYTNSKSVSSGVSTEVNDLVEGRVYYFAVTATGANGVISALSDEVRFVNEHLPEGTEAIESSKHALVYPNPYRKGDSEPKFHYVLNADKEIEISVFDTAGRKIWSRTYQPGSDGGRAGSNSPSFTLITDGGAAVKNGTYIFRILSGSTVLKQGKFVILK